ncbi:MAG: sulfurtransferase [Acidimicrobiia bacterium]
MQSHLIDAASLRTEIDRPGTIVIDCRWYLGEPDRGLLAYNEGHLPGARYVSLDGQLSGRAGAGRHPLPSPEAFAAAMSALGISNDSRVVVYDDRGGAVAARLWWMLTAQGSTKTSVLDGGIQAWISQGGGLESNTPAPSHGRFAAGDWTGVVAIDAVSQRQPDVAVIDARSAERYRGDAEPVDQKAGHIPGAVSMPLSDNLTEDLYFHEQAVLRHRFTSAGIKAGDTTISQCGSGVTACHNILAMELAGLGRPDLYVGSWSDWSSSDHPVATGDQP